MLTIDVKAVAVALKNAAATPGMMPQDWRAGCDSACEHIANDLVEILSARNADFDSRAFLRAAGLI